VPGHNRNFGARKHISYPIQKFNAGHLRHDQIGQYDVRWLFFEQRQRRLAIAGFHACKTQATRDCKTQTADTLLVINH
jgi:hypothetical protein